METLVREPIQRFIQALLAAEVTTLSGRSKSARRAAVEAAKGRRNGDGNPRRFTLTPGTVTVRRPRLRGWHARGVRRVLPWCTRRTRAAGEWLPPLELPGLALGDVDGAPRGRVGEAAPRSPTARTRLKAPWQLAYAAWKRRRRDDLEVVAVWAAGWSVNAGLADRTAALRVRSGARTHGQNMALAVERGQRASPESWGAVLRDRRARGWPPWRGTLADGPLGIGAALGEQPPAAAEPRGWTQRSTNVLAAIPQKQPAQARPRLRARPAAERQAAGEARRDRWAKRHSQLAPKAVEGLAADWERLGPFDQCPREPGRHRRTTTVVESPVAAARRRTTAANRFTKVDSATALIGNLRQWAEQTCRRRNAPAVLPAV